MNLVLIVAVGLAIMAGGLLGWYGRKFIERIETLEEIGKRRKLPYPALAGLEDAIALSDDARFENGSMDKMISFLLMALQKDIAARKYQDARFAQVIDILKVLRDDPQAYDSETPSTQPAQVKRK